MVKGKELSEIKLNEEHIGELIKKIYNILKISPDESTETDLAKYILKGVGKR